MSCISSNFSSFFLNSLNDSSEFAKYLSNGELKFSSFEDFQVFGSGAGAGTSPAPPSPAAAGAASSSSLTAQQAATQQQQQYYNGGVGNSGNTNNNANLSAGANTTGLPSGIEQPYNNGVAAMNSIGNCGGTETANTSALTPANASNTAPAGVQQLQHGAHLHAAHHTPQHPNTHLPHHPHQHPHAQHPYAGHAPHTPGSLAAPSNAFHSHNHLASPHLTTAATTPNYPTTPQRWTTAAGASPMVSAAPGTPHPITQLQNSNQSGTPIAANPSGAQHFDGSFEFLKYLRHSNDYNNSEPQGDAAAGSASAGQAPASTSSSSSLIDLDSSTSHKSRSSRKAAALLSSVSRTSNSLDANALDVFDHDSKHTIFDMHHMTATNSSNSNESSMEVSNLAFPSSHLNASNSNTSSEGAATGSSDFAMLHSSSAASAPKPLATFTIKDNFDVHPSHKVEEGIFQHMNKLPAKKKENLKQLGVRFTGQMTLSDKSIVVENFIKFCQEYDVQDHRPFLSLNQSGLNKADQIKFARYLGQGLPTFTLFCIYSNFKNLFCTKRTEIYTKDGYNLPYILDKTKRFLSNTTAGNTPSKGNPSSSHSQTQPQSQSLPQSQPQSQQQQQQAPSQSQQQATPQTQQQTAPKTQQQPTPQTQSQPQQHPTQLQQQQIPQTPQQQPAPQLQQQQQIPQTPQQQPTLLQQQPHPQLAQQPPQFQQQPPQSLQSQPIQLKPLQTHPMQAYPLQSLALQSQQLHQPPHPLQSQSPQLQSLAAAHHQLRTQSPHTPPMQPLRPMQTQPLQAHPLQQQQQQQPLQPHPYQSQPLQPHPLQTQPLQPQPPKPPLATQTHAQLLHQHTPSSPLPPGHLQQLQLQQQHQQQQQQSPVHMPLSMSRGLSK